MKLLVVLLDGQRAGTITEDSSGRLRLTYDDDWRSLPTATPLSLSMPIAVPSHDDPIVRAFIWGLLPDSEHVLDRWARRYQVSARNPFALLCYVGEDCAGAAQFALPGRVDGLLAGEGGVEWIGKDDIAHRLRTLRRDPAAWHMATAGQFSLAGAQAKTALHYEPESERWGDPWGAVPTTHILKPAVVGFDEHDLNEHLCLEAARLLGINSARSDVRSFGEERAIVIERYDRIRAEGGRVQRIHQEDVCQAIGRLPTEKYQNEGGPTPERRTRRPTDRRPGSPGVAGPHAARGRGSPAAGRGARLARAGRHGVAGRHGRGDRWRSSSVQRPERPGQCHGAGIPGRAQR